MPYEEMKKMDFETLFGGCLFTIQETMTETPRPLGLVHDFRVNLLENINTILPSKESRANPTASMGLLLEELIRAAAKMLVCLAAVGPCSLRNDGIVSEEDESLLQRAIEEKLLELVNDSFKKCVQRDHSDLSEFRTERR